MAWAAARRVLSREAGYGEAVALLKRVAAARRAMPRGAPPADWLAALERALDELGALPGCAQDAAGETLLELLRPTRGARRRVTATDFWRVARLAEPRAGARGLRRSRHRQPLVMTHLAATRLRRFDAAILIGADRDNLGPTFSRAVFGNLAVRAELGLSLPAETAARLRDDLAGLIACCGEVTATWQTLRGDEANLPCPELSLLSVLHQRAWGDDLVQCPPPALDPHSHSGGGTPMPRPAAPQRVPLRLSPAPMPA
jgi:ATP-dependent helicase/nuclease subunit B